ncbi:MAG: accessory factor UbiK family protein [Alphaproteobacteria bacterium]|nr:accessory factor UbiK family protein [Alphaproteobacteria bacterium]
MAVDAMGTFSGVKKEVETIVGLRVNKIINKMNLVRRDEFEVLKKLVQKLIIENQNLKQKKSSSIKRNPLFKKKKKKVVKKRA